MKLGKSRGKILVPLLLMLLGNEVISTISLIAILVMFLSGIVKEAERHGV